jgi:hypothetical protein
MGSLLAKLPPKEQLVFVLALVFIAYLALLATPTSARTTDNVRRATLLLPETHADLGEQKITAELERALQGIPQTTPRGGDRLKQAIDRRLAAPVAPERMARETPFRPSSQVYERLPPVFLRDVVVTGIPGFDPPTGLAPSIVFQVRPKVLPSGRVRLVRQEDVFDLD